MKYIYIAVGFLFLGLGAIGAFLPLLPTTPFLLVTAYCFAKGSERFHLWFTGTKLYKKYLESYVQTRSMTLKSKLSILALSTSMIMLAFFLMNNIYGRCFILAVIAFKYYYFFFRIKTIKPVRKDTAAEELL